MILVGIGGHLRVESEESHRVVETVGRLQLPVHLHSLQPQAGAPLVLSEHWIHRY